MSYPPSAPGGYGGGYVQPKTSQLGIWALVTGILGFCCGPLSIVAIVLGVMGRKEIDSSNGARTGRGLAVAGLVLGIVALVINVIYYILLATGHASFYINSGS